MIVADEGGTSDSSSNLQGLHVILRQSLHGKANELHATTHSYHSFSLATIDIKQSIFSNL